MNDIPKIINNRVILIIYICVYISWIMVIIGFTPLLVSNVIFPNILLCRYFILGVSVIFFIYISFLFIKYWKTIVVKYISIYKLVIIILLSIIMGVVLLLSPFLFNIHVGSFLYLYNIISGIVIIMLNLLFIIGYCILLIKDHDALRNK
jgi:hypothetical protein